MNRAFSTPQPLNDPRRPSRIARAAAGLAGGLLLHAVLALVAGCHGATPEPGPDPRGGDRLFESGDYAGAARLYEAYLAASPAGEEADRALFRLAVIRLMPDTPLEDWKAARGLCRKLVEAFPSSPYRASAEVVLHLQGEVERLFKQLEELKRIDLEGAH